MDSRVSAPHNAELPFRRPADTASQIQAPLFVGYIPQRPERPFPSQQALLLLGRRVEPIAKAAALDHSAPRPNALGALDVAPDRRGRNLVGRPHIERRRPEVAASTA